MKKTEIRSIQFLKSGKDAAEMLDLIDETFHQMPLAIPPFIVFSLFFGAWMSWYHHFYIPLQQAIHKGLSRISPISDNPLKAKAFNQALRLCDVVGLSRTQAETQGIAQTIHRHMNLAAISPATAPQSLLLAFFGHRRHKDALEQSCCQ